MAFCRAGRAGLHWRTVPPGRVRRDDSRRLSVTVGPFKGLPCPSAQIFAAYQIPRTRIPGRIQGPRPQVKTRFSLSMSGPYLSKSFL